MKPDILIKRFRKKIQRGKAFYGPFMKTGDPMFVEIAGLAGFDFAILDMEHGPVSLQEQQNNVRAAVARDILPIIRVNDLSENSIGSALDIGACGIQVPQIANAEEAKCVVDYARFYPYGKRGVCRFVRAADYSAKDRNKYFQESKDIIIVIQIEGREAIEDLDNILQVKGIDIIFIGPYDLSQSLGVPGQIDNPVVVNEIKKITKKAKLSGKTIGTFVDQLSYIHFWKKYGIKYLSYNTDAGIFMEACKNIIDNINKKQSD